MREIRFRAWNGSKMLDTVGVHPFMCFRISDAFPEDEDKYTDNTGDMICTPNLQSIMQYTGLKDKNGKEIYEGDVCIAWNTEYGSVIPGNFKGVVKFFETSFYVDNNRAAFLVWQEIAQWEVIGNVYESPKLLEAVSND